MNTPENATNSRRLLWGMLLAWVPLLVLLVPTAIQVFGSLSAEKATGVGAVAGGVSEALVTWGIVALVVCQLGALLLLVRAFSPGHELRRFVAFLSICASGATLLLVGLFLWLAWARPLR